MTAAMETGSLTPPHDIEAEQISLGAMMLSPGVLDDVAVILSAGDYCREAHKAIHAALVRLRDASEPTDPVAVRMELQRTGELVGSLDASYLFSLVEAVPLAANGPFYARKVAKLARTWKAQRGLISAAQIVNGSGFDPDVDMDRVRQMVDGAMGAPSVGGTAEWLSQAAWDQLARLEQPRPADEITPPYADLREYVRALRPGQLITVAARPGVGKTLVLGDFARHVGLRLGLPVAWFTLEMSRDEVVNRIFSAEAVIDHDRLQGDDLTNSELKRLLAVTQSFEQSQVLIDEKSAATLSHMLAGLRKMERTVKPRLMLVDYVQLAQAPGVKSRQEEVSVLARGLKEIAKDHGIPVVMAAQLNRNAEGRHDKKPVQADLRESGELENSSDVVILLHREDAYEPESPRAGEMDLLLTKNRNGRNNKTVTVTFQGSYCRCVDLSRQPEPRRAWSPHDVIGDAA